MRAPDISGERLILAATGSQLSGKIKMLRVTAEGVEIMNDLLFTE